MPPTVLVTGANGFLGRHLVAELLRRNYSVRALVRPSDGNPYKACP
jgi:dihydroflavonol-4-reductase